MAKRFRYKRSIPVGYDGQGSIYFLFRRYHKLEKEEQKRLRGLCRNAAGIYAQAVIEYLTGDDSEEYICRKHHLSPSTLERMVKRLYIAVADIL